MLCPGTGFPNIVHWPASVVLAVGWTGALLPQALKPFFLILSIDLGETASFDLLQLLAAKVLCYLQLKPVLHWFRWDGGLWSVPAIGRPGALLPHPHGRGYGLVHQARLKSLDKLAKNDKIIFFDSYSLFTIRMFLPQEILKFPLLEIICDILFW